MCNAVKNRLLFKNHLMLTWHVSGSLKEASVPLIWGCSKMLILTIWCSSFQLLKGHTDRKSLLHLALIENVNTTTTVHIVINIKQTKP